MINVILWFDPDNGEVVPDNKIEHWFNTIASNPTGASAISCTIGSRAMLTRMRLGLVEEHIESLKVVIDDRAFKCYQDGTMDHAAYSLIPDVEYEMIRKMARRTAPPREDNDEQEPLHDRATKAPGQQSPEPLRQMPPLPES